MARSRTKPPLDLSASPLYMLSVLFSARRSKDRMLERITRKRLEDLGLKIQFGDELPAPSKAKAVANG